MVSPRTPLLLLGLLCPMLLCAQNLPLSFRGAGELLRRSQLTGEWPGNASLTQQAVPWPDSVPTPSFTGFDGMVFPVVRSEQGSLSLLSPYVGLEFNSHHPYPVNNGAMIPAKGVQTLLSPGLYGRYLFAEFQLRPEFLYAQNAAYPGFPENGGKYIYLWWNRQDVPERFGTGPYRKLLAGQSFFRLRYKDLALGLSTENLWWGPGKYNSLLMSNNARGFTHLTFQTVQPLETPIGSWEFRLIAGRLRNSGFNPDTSRYFFHNQLFVPKYDHSRYLNGIALTWQPKWIPGLFLGINSTVQQYDTVAQINRNYLPVFTNIYKDPHRLGNQQLTTDTYASLFARWVMNLGELYAEYGRNNASWRLEELITHPEEDAAVVVGFSKLIPLRKTGRYIEVDAEITQLQQPPDYIVRSEAKSWYTHPTIRQGYTHSGEVLGTGIGSGSNLQLIRVSWVNGYNRIGIRAERLTHNNDYHYYTFSQFGYFHRYWIDYGIGLDGSWKFKHLLADLRIHYSNSLNYQWEPEPGPWFDPPAIDRKNWHATLNLVYLFQ